MLISLKVLNVMSRNISNISHMPWYAKGAGRRILQQACFHIQNCEHLATVTALVHNYCQRL